LGNSELEIKKIKKTFNLIYLVKNVFNLIFLVKKKDLKM